MGAFFGVEISKHEKSMHMCVRELGGSIEEKEEIFSPKL